MKWFNTSAFILPIYVSTNEFALAAFGGMRIHRTSGFQKASNLSGYFRSRSRMRNLGLIPSSSIHIEALRACLDKLRSADRQLITDRYYEEMSVKDMAAQLGKNAAAVSVKLMRIRAVLRKCYEKKMRDTQNRRP